MADKKNSRTAVRFSVPTFKTGSFFESLCFIDSDLEVIDIYRDVLHTRLIVHLVFLPSLSWEQCHESFRRYCDNLDFDIDDVRESDIDPES